MKSKRIGILDLYTFKDMERDLLSLHFLRAFLMGNYTNNIFNFELNWKFFEIYIIIFFGWELYRTMLLESY